MDLSENIGISKPINIADVHEFHEDVPIYPGPSSRTSSFEEKGTAVGQESKGKMGEANFDFY